MNPRDYGDTVARVELFERARRRLLILAGLGLAAMVVGVLFALVSG